MSTNDIVWDIVQGLRQELADCQPPAEPNTITVIVSGGRVLGVEGLPRGWEWAVRDYDICATCGGTDPHCPWCHERLAKALASALASEGAQNE